MTGTPLVSPRRCAGDAVWRPACGFQSDSNDDGVRGREVEVEPARAGQEEPGEDGGPAVGGGQDRRSVQRPSPAVQPGVPHAQHHQEVLQVVQHCRHMGKDQDPPARGAELREQPVEVLKLSGRPHQARVHPPLVRQEVRVVAHLPEPDE
jgi:hypothetical protein